MSARFLISLWRILIPCALLVLGPWIFFQLRGLAMPGGDSWEMVNRLVYPWHFFMRAPLVIILNKTLWGYLQPYDWPPIDCIALSSALAGGVYLFSLWILTRNPWIWIVCLCSKTLFIFMGHIENYAWPYALSLLCFALSKLQREGVVSSWFMWAAAGVTFFFHPLTLMIWPGLAWSLERWDKPRLIEIVVVSVIVVAVFDFFLVVGNVDGFFTRSWFLTLGAGQLCPYSLQSWEHWRLLLGFHLHTLPVGFLLLVCYWKNLPAGWPQGVGLTAVIALIWSSFWCPSKGVEDWDLFAFPALFVNLAGAVGFVRARSQYSNKDPQKGDQAAP